MKHNKKTLLIVFPLLVVSVVLSACTMNTQINVTPTLCRRYFLKKNISFVETDDVYEELADENKTDISSMFTTEMINEAYTHIDFHYDGTYQFLLSDLNNEQKFYDEGTYVLSGKVNYNEKITLNSNDGTSKECTSLFIRKSDQDTIITYLRVPFKLQLEGEDEESDVFLWFFNGIFVPCIFSEDSSQ